MSHLTLLAVLTARAGQAAALGARLQSLVEPTLKEPGCVMYRLHQSRDNADVWMIYEVWASQADLDRHFAKPYLVDFMANKNEVLAKDIEMTVFEGV